MADRELTTPAFVARISASAGCDLASRILAALQVHFGSEFGLCCDRLEALLDGGVRLPSSRIVEAPAMPRRSTPGFDNPLYINGHPPANFLLGLALELEGQHRRASQSLQPIAKHFPAVQIRINVYEALVILCRSLGLPYQAASGLLALSRSAGCVAHVLDQRAQSSIIRPRGKFVRPTSDSWSTNTALLNLLHQ